MIDKSSVADSLQKLANEVRASDPGGYDRLSLLSNAVQNEAHASAWAYADVHSMIAPDSIVERYRQNARSDTTDKLVTFLEIIRNTLIFAPIIVTWYGISQATASYSELINSAIRNKQLDLYSQPFLYLWQQRFGGTLPNYLTLSSIATADVVILFIILSFTFFAYLLSNSGKAQKDQDAQRLRANLQHAITGAVLSLHARPQLTAENNLELVARNLDTTIHYIVDQVKDMSQQSITHLDSIAQNTTMRIEQMAQTATTSLGQMAHNVTEQFSNTTQQTMKHLEQIAQEMNQQVLAGKEYLTQLGSLTTGIVQTASEIQAAANGLKTTNSSLTNSINNLTELAKLMAQQQALLLDAAQQSVKFLQDNAQSISHLVNQQQKKASELTDTLDTFTLAVEKFAALGQEESDLVHQHETFLQHLQNEHDKQGQLAVLLSDATVGVKNALGEMNTGAVSLRSMAVSMNDMMRLQAAMVSNPGMAVPIDLSNITRSYENAASVMESSGNTLKASAIAIQKASQQLRDVLDDTVPGRTI